MNMACFFSNDNNYRVSQKKRNTNSTGFLALYVEVSDFVLHSKKDELHVYSFPMIFFLYPKNMK